MIEWPPVIIVMGILQGSTDVRRAALLRVFAPSWLQAANALKHSPLGQPDRRQNSMFDRVETDRPPDDLRVRPTRAVDFGIVPVAVYHKFVAAVLERELVHPPDQIVARLVLNARHPWIQAAVHAQTVRILMVGWQV